VARCSPSSRRQHGDAEKQGERGEMSRPVPSTAGRGRGGGDADDHRWGEADGGGCGILRRPLRRRWKWGVGAGAGGRGGGVRDSAVFFTWASEERFLEAAGLATLRQIRGGAGQGGEGQRLGEEGRHAGPSAAREGLHPGGAAVGCRERRRTGAGVAGGGLRAPDLEMGRRAWICET